MEKKRCDLGHQDERVACFVFLKAQEFFDVLIEIKKECTYLNYVDEDVAFKTRIDNSYINSKSSQIYPKIIYNGEFDPGSG